MSCGVVQPVDPTCGVAQEVEICTSGGSLNMGDAIGGAVNGAVLYTSQTGTLAGGTEFYFDPADGLYIDGGAAGAGAFLFSVDDVTSIKLETDLNGLDTWEAHATSIAINQGVGATVVFGADATTTSLGADGLADFITMTADAALNRIVTVSEILRLNNNATATLAPANVYWLRHNTGVLQYSYNGGAWTAVGGGLAIGGSISGGTAGRVLFEAAGPVLADSANFTYSAASFNVTATASIVEGTNYLGLYCGGFAIVETDTSVAAGTVFINDNNGASVWTVSENSYQFYGATSTAAMQFTTSSSYAQFSVPSTTNGGMGFLFTTTAAPTSGAQTFYRITQSNPTGQTASNEIPFYWITPPSRQWATGAIATQREVRIDAPTYSFVAASVITEASTLWIGGPPVASTNATITRSWALNIAGDYSTTNTTVDYINMNRTTTGVAAVNLGVAMTTQLEDAGGNIYLASRQATIQQTATSTTPSSQIDFYTVAAGTLALQFSLGSATRGVYIPTASRLAFGTPASNPIAMTLTSGRFRVATTGSAYGMEIVPAAINSGAQGPTFQVINAANNSQTASTEIRGVLFDFSNTRQWLAGAIATQREMVILAPTYAFSSASTITTAATVYIDDAPQAGANATITTSYAFWVDAGIVRIDGAVALGGGAAPTLGTIGGAGPAAAAQNEWLRIDTQNGVRFVPVWA